MKIWRKLESSDAVRLELSSKLDISFTATCQTLVVKKLLEDSVDDQQEFTKEARMLHSLQHENDVSFKAFCQRPNVLSCWNIYVLSFRRLVMTSIRMCIACENFWESLCYIKENINKEPFIHSVYSFKWGKYKDPERLYPVSNIRRYCRVTPVLYLYRKPSRNTPREWLLTTRHVVDINLAYTIKKRKIYTNVEYNFHDRCTYLTLQAVFSFLGR